MYIFKIDLFIKVGLETAIDKRGYSGTNGDVQFSNFKELIIGETKHILNPLHVYCRLIDIGLSKSIAKTVCSFYERTLFRTFISNGKPSYFSKLLKTLDIFSPDAEN